MSVVNLRPFTAGDSAWLDEWFAPVAASVGYSGLDLTHPGASLLSRIGAISPPIARVIVREDVCAGIVICSLDTPRVSAAIVEIIATTPEAARRGSGMAAAAAIERELQAVGVRTIYAPAPAIHGIDVYFWIRLGYHPILRGGWPCSRPGVAWLSRDIVSKVIAEGAREAEADRSEHGPDG